MFQLVSEDKYDFKEYNFMNFKTFLFALSFSVFFSFSQSTFSQTHVSSDQLTEAIKEARLTNPELRYIKNLAKRMGVRVWLLGGSASSLAYYVKKDLERKKDKNKGWFKPQKEHFDYDYTKIFFPTQDIDLVVEGGSEEKVSRLEEEISKKFPYFQGNSNKSAWEVRPLRESRGPKAPLLEGDVLKQHTDSYSVMMIELSESKDPVVRSIKEWDSRNPSLLEDLLKGEISYYDSKNHKETQRYNEGMNPEIFSVIRYLIKMFQYELKPKKEDLERIKEIINEFSASELKTGYAKFWWEMNVRKLFMQNSDLERTWRVLDELGLKEKLISLGGDQKRKESLAFWFHKEPLRTKKIREGEGRTAKDLGIEIVSHETSDFEAYEIITRSLEGKPNIFISRKNAKEEAAAFGEGLYTMKGLTGRAGTGFTIRFHVHPEAREGADFALDGDIVIFRNKAVLRVIPDSFNLSLNFREFFEFLKRSEKNWDNEKGLLERLKRKNRELLNSKVSDKDLDYVYKEIVLDSIEGKNSSWEVILQEWLKKWLTMDISLKDKEVMKILKYLIKEGDSRVSSYILEHLLLKDLVIQEYHEEWMKLVKYVIERGFGSYIIEFVLSKDLVIQEYHEEWMKFMEVLMKKHHYSVYISEFVLSKDLVIREYHEEWMKFIEVMIEKGYGVVHVVAKVLSKNLVIQEYHEEWMKFMEVLIKHNYYGKFILRFVLSRDLVIREYYEEWMKFMEVLIKRDRIARHHVTKTLLDKSVIESLQKGKLAQTLIEKGILTRSIKKELAKKDTQWKEWLQTTRRKKSFFCKFLF